LGGGKIRIGGMKYETLSLAQINLEDERFRTSFHPDLSRLILSIKKVGLLSPPLVCRGPQGFVLVSGWKRVLACRELGLPEIGAFVTEKKDDLRLFLLGLYENLAAREIGTAEKAEVVSKLLKFGVDKKALLRNYLPLLSLPATAAHLEVLLGLSRADRAVREFVEKKELPLALVQSLLQFKPVEQNLLLPLLRPLGQNKQKEIIEGFWEISRRDDVSLQKVLRETEIRQALGSPRLSALQKAEKVRSILRRKRYPQLSSWQEAFASTLRRVRWPRSVAIQPSPYFEGEDISVSFRFKNEAEFKAGLKKLEEVSEKREFSQLFKR
jgi:ParB family chromosome partitioning protein